MNTLQPDPKVSDVWMHHSGRMYKVLMFANTSVEATEKYPHMIVYQNVDNGTIWTRRLDDWQRSFKFVR